MKELKDGLKSKRLVSSDPLKRIKQSQRARGAKNGLKSKEREEREEREERAERAERGSNDKPGKLSFLGPPPLVLDGGTDIFMKLPPLDFLLSLLPLTSINHLPLATIDHLPLLFSIVPIAIW